MPNKVQCPMCPGTMDKRSTKCADCNESRGLIVNLIGQRFEMLIVTGLSKERRGKGERMWDCLCDCGRTTTTTGHLLRAGKSGSCGHRGGSYKHGESRSPEYISWNNMRARCENPEARRYCDYGGRGITVCERWADFENFLADMGRKPSLGHSIDRIDNDGPYSPENCRWATKTEQMRNRNSNRYLTHGGETLLMIEWAERLGCPSSVIHKRITRGWSVEKAVTTPPGAKWTRRKN